VTELDLPVDFDAISRGLNMIVLHTEASTLFLPECRLDHAGLCPGGTPDNALGQSKVHADVTAVVEGKLHPSPSKAEYLKAIDELARLRPIFDEIASEYDAIVTPSAPGAAPEGLEWTGDSRFCGMWTALHVPVVNIPAFVSDEGMPLGLTLVGARYV
jgi:Asp-tRNA(Asn)/Glu-tRNA(Gln) amidotransferase A subunit family amidase